MYNTMGALLIIPTIFQRPSRNISQRLYDLMVLRKIVTRLEELDQHMEYKREATRVA
jgi:hypothetical protein